MYKYIKQPPTIFKIAYSVVHSKQPPQSSRPLTLY